MNIENQSQEISHEAQPALHDGQRIPTFLKVSIILLAALSIAAIVLLFVGDFQGKFERIFSTFIAFAIFVGLTAVDTRINQRNEWYAPVALIANSYILALMLIVIWMTPASYALGFEIFWKGVLALAVTRAVVAIAQWLLSLGDGRPRPLSNIALATSILATIAGILFTAPMAIEVFRLRVPDLYWRFAVATLLLTGLGFTITMLLRWAYSGQDRDRRRRDREARAAIEAQQYASQALPGALPAPAQPVAPSAPHSYVQQAPATAPAIQAEPYVAAVPEPAIAATQVAAPAQPLLPWPTYPDGRPLPVRPDGQPDFSALQN